MRFLTIGIDVLARCGNARSRYTAPNTGFYLSVPRQFDDVFSGVPQPRHHEDDFHAMDEYRPYPAEQPRDDGDLPESASGLQPHSSVQPNDSGEPAAEPQASLIPELKPSSRAADDEDDQEQRPPPDLDHPGGHLIGTVARLNRPRRFGFLRAEDGVEVFFHASSLEAGPNAFDKLRTGQPVEFDCHQDEQGRGLAATLVRVTGEPPEQPRAPRQPREERPAKPSRRTRGWHVAVIQERHESPVSDQLERLLNERSLRPGQFTLSLLERETGTECWVVYHVDDSAKK
jgi:cold shock CspA family protein